MSTIKTIDGIPYIDVIPNTSEWEKDRRGEEGIRIGASSASVVCGTNKTALPAQYYDWIKLGCPKTQDPNIYTEHGHEIEPYIRDNIYQKFLEENNIVKEGRLYLSKRYPNYYGATTDADVFDKNTNKWLNIAEFKGPYHNIYENLNGASSIDDIPEEYYCQVQMQLWITEREFCDFVAACVKKDINDPTKYSISGSRYMWFRLYPNPPYQEWMVRRLKRFTSCLINNERPDNETFTVKNKRDIPNRINYINMATLIHTFNEYTDGFKGFDYEQQPSRRSILKVHNT